MSSNGVSNSAAAELESIANELNFTTDMSEKMTVPRHILAVGDSRNGGMENGRAAAAAKRAVSPNSDPHLRSRMNVPDRIVVAGGNSHKGYSPVSKPLEMAIEHSFDSIGKNGHRVVLNTPPSTLTLHNQRQPQSSSDGYSGDSATTAAGMMNGGDGDEHGAGGGSSGGVGGVDHTTPHNQGVNPNAPEWFRHMGLPFSPPGSGGPGGSMSGGNPLDEIRNSRRTLNDLKHRVALLEEDMDYRNRRDYILMLVAGVYFAVKVAKKFITTGE